MGVPKFFRWLSERYPKINQPIRCKPASSPATALDAISLTNRGVPLEEEETNEEVVEDELLEDIQDCYIVPTFDRLYIDANGMLHGASHNNSSSSSHSEDEEAILSQEEIVKNVCHYLDRIVEDIVKPKELLYFAIDGVAPRAKLCQQRSRRYRSGKEQEIIAGLHLLKTSDNTVERTSDGRYSGTIYTSAAAAATASSATADNQDTDAFLVDEDMDEEGFHLNAITPGTKFLNFVSTEILKHIQRKVATDVRWQHLKVIFSGPDVPGEGEHKIMQFIREQKFLDSYNPNTRHCLFGQDGDLIILGLATHEPHFCLLREEVKFGPARARHEALAFGKSMQEISNEYVQQSNFQLLHMSVLRDYLALEFETSNIYADSRFDIERTIDDFCFLTFFVGNDFLPHMPALDIADGAFDILFHTYRKHRKLWWRDGADGNNDPYLTNSGKIVSGKRLEVFLGDLGRHEDPFLWKAKKGQADLYNLIRKDEKKFGRNRPSLIPSDKDLVSIEEKQHEQFKAMMASISSAKSETILSSKDGNNIVIQSTGTHSLEQNEKSPSFKPVTTSGKLPAMLKSRPRMTADNDNLVLDGQVEDEFLKYLSGLVMASITPPKGGANNINGNRFGSNGSRRARSSFKKHRSSSIGEINVSSDAEEVNKFSDESSSSTYSNDLKGRYYFDKFGFTPVDMEQHKKLRKSYIEGLVWCLEYYYRGCVSWDWYYPFHYGPMFSDLVEIDTFLSEITFSNGQPLRPFEQLLACLPPSSSYLLPRPYRWLMTSDQSPIIDYYPVDFACDTSGKRFPWEFTVLLPFIDGNKLSATCRQMVTDEMLSEEERQINEFGDALLLTYDNNYAENSTNALTAVDAVKSTPYTSLNPTDKDAPRFIPYISPETVLPYPGFSTLMDAPVESLVRRRNGIKVFGTRSRYKTALLNISKPILPLPPLHALSKQFVGTCIYIRYPHFLEAFVTAVSDEIGTCRGNENPRPWNKNEVIAWKAKRDTLKAQYANGDGSVGSGGCILPESSVTFSVRPLQQIVTTEDGEEVKIFAKFEVEVPIAAALLVPSSIDNKMKNLAMLLEENPYQFGANQKKGSAQLVDLFGGIANISSKFISGNEGNWSSAPIRSSTAFVTGRPKARTEVTLQKQCLYSSLSKISNNPSLGSLPVVNRKSFHVDPRYLPLKIEPTVAPLRNLQNSLINQPAHTSQPGRRCMKGRGFAVAAFGVFVFAAMQTKVRSHPTPLIHRVFIRPTEATWKPLLIRGGDAEIQTEEIHQFSDPLRTPPLEFAHGTTTISFVFRDGIVAAVDSRASIGQFVGSRTVQKVLPIHRTMLGTMAGGAADCSFWIRKLRSEAKKFHLEDGDGRTLSVARASMWLSSYLYENRSLKLSVGTMIMGVDQHSGEASIYYTDDQGSRIRGDLFAVGSGSTFALGILDSETDAETRLQMTESEAVALAIKAIRHATFRDAYSGGYIGVYVVTKEGWKKVFSEDLALVEIGK